MKYIFLLCISFFPFGLSGQARIPITRTIAYSADGWIDQTKKVTEFYSVLSNDTSVKDGAYVLLKSDGTTLILGMYSNGVKTGLWQYYSYQTNQLFEQYNYDTGNDLFYQSPPAVMLMKNNNGFVLDSIDSQPHLPGQQGFFFALGSVKYPQLAKEMGISGIVYISIQLDTNGTFKLDSIDYSPSIKPVDFRVNSKNRSKRLCVFYRNTFRQKITATKSMYDLSVYR